MLHKLAIVLLPVALLVASCGGGSVDDNEARESGDASVEDVGPAGPDGIYNTADDDFGADPGNDSVVGVVDDHAAADTVLDAGKDADLGGSSLLGALNPFTMLGGLGAAPGSLQDVDPDLRAALLTLDDVPAGFEDMGEFSFSMPTELGDVEMAVTMFGQGVTADDFGAMLMSGAMSLPPEALAEFDDLRGLSEEQLAEMEDLTGALGADFADFQMLDARDLGDGGFGMHMEMDFAALFSAFGAPEDQTGSTGIAMDMYAFLSGDQLLMTMVMWPAGESPGADALALAELMESRA